MHCAALHACPPSCVQASTSSLLVFSVAVTGASLLRITHCVPFCYGCSPADKAKCVFARCRWSRSGQPLLYAMVNYRMRGDQGSYLVAYGPPDAPGKPWQLLKKVKANDNPASAMDISKHGEWIAAGYSDGMLRVSAGQLTVHGHHAEQCSKCCPSLRVPAGQPLQSYMTVCHLTVRTHV
jgi:hypothetical protein